MKTCSKCGETKPLTSFSPHAQCRQGVRPECKACYTAAEKLRPRSHRPSVQPAAKRRVQLKLKYGITPEQYDDMLAAQNGVCAICGSADPGWARLDRMPVDHDHVTGEVRGILCHHCNTLLGAAKDSVGILTEAIAYLRRA